MHAYMWSCHADDGGRDDGLGAFDQKLMGWAIRHEDIEICRRSDGTEWLLVRTCAASKLTPTLIDTPC